MRGLGRMHDNRYVNGEIRAKRIRIWLQTKDAYTLQKPVGRISLRFRRRY